ncbi:MAG: hypothetical protein V4612_06940 [Pseudomonadota bacterium]
MAQALQEEFGEKQFKEHLRPLLPQKILEGLDDWEVNDFARRLAAESPTLVRSTSVRATVSANLKTGLTKDNQTGNAQAL